MNTEVMDDGLSGMPGTLDVWNEDGSLNEQMARTFATRADVEEMEDFGLSFAGRMRTEDQADGSVRLHWNENGRTAHKVAGMRANENRGVLGMEDYKAVIHEAAIYGSSMYDKTNPDRLMDNIFAEVWVEGVEDMLGMEKDVAKGMVRSEIRWVLERCGTLDGHDEVKEIEERITKAKVGAAERYSRAGQAREVYRKVGEKTEVNEAVARRSAALYNIYRYSEGVRAEYWRDKGEEMPELVGERRQVPDGEWWKEAKGFAAWYAKRRASDVEDYAEAWATSAREEILRRLGNERSKNLDFNEVNAIVNAVLYGRGDDKNGVGYDDSYKWKGVISPEDVQRARDARVAEWRGRKVLPDGKEGMKRVREGVAAAAEEAAKAKAAAKEEEEAKKKAEKDAAVQEKRRKAVESEPLRGRSWAYDGCDNDSETKGVRVPEAVYKQLCEDYGLRARSKGAGDEVYVRFKVGSKTVYLPVIGTHAEGEEVLLNARAVGDIKYMTNGRRGKYAKTDWYSHVERGCDMTFMFKRNK